MMFYRYNVRQTEQSDACDPFWLRQGEGCESFIVQEGAEVLGFFQARQLGTLRNQVRLAFDAWPTTSPKKILRAITKLVPLIEKALALRGVRAIFFTSHSVSMAAFMGKHHGYAAQWDMDGGADGIVMAKRIQ